MLAEVRMSEQFPKFHGTTILGVIKDGEVAIGGDGQVTFGNTVMKHKSNKIRLLYNGQVLAGFAGAAADALTLFEIFEEKLKNANGNLTKAAVELAKEWRKDRFLRRLEAMIAVANREKGFIISGTGDVLEPDDQILAIGSGGPYALAAARALKSNSNLPAREIVDQSLKIAADICIYTNDKINIESL